MKLSIFLLLSVFLINFVSADYLPHTQNTNLNFSFSDTLAINCNISTMDTPNSTVTINQQMIKVGSTFKGFIAANNFTVLGTYCINLECVDGYGSICREVTPTGTILSTEESIIYGILALSIFVLFAVTFYFSIALPYKNTVDENKGAIIKICKLKYVKLGLVMLSWAFFTWFLNILIGLSDNFVTLTMYYGFFSFLFNVMNKLSWPLGIIILIIMSFEVIRDSNIQKEINKFGSSKR